MSHCTIIAGCCILLIISQPSISQFNSALDVPENPDFHPLHSSKCHKILSHKWRNNIKKYRKVARRIVDSALHGDFKGRLYNDLRVFVDTFGNRISGSESLENSIDYMAEKFKKIGLHNITEQKVAVPKWVRGAESAKMIHPFPKKLNILGLGTSVGTPPEGIIADVVVVKDMEELKELGTAGTVKGKIVLYNFHVHYYSVATSIVKNAASNASLYGAVAALTKSITRVSVNSPHTKMQKYEENVPKIPVASVTVEDAELIGRLYKSGKTVTVNLMMQSVEYDDSTSRNLLGDYLGRRHPEKLVLISAHIDSWDVGQGAQDDGVGVFLTYETIKLLEHLKLRPRRTMRAVLWTAEELSSAGTRTYIKEFHHEDERKSHSVIMEADLGCFKPVGFHYSKLPEVGCILHQITKLFRETNTTVFIPVKELPNDLNEFLKDENVPAVSFIGNDGRYFWYHHTDGDTMSATNTHDLDKCLAVWAATSYILADMKHDLPR